MSFGRGMGIEIGVLREKREKPLCIKKKNLPSLKLDGRIWSLKMELAIQPIVKKEGE